MSVVYEPKIHRMIIPEHYGDHLDSTLGLCLHVAQANGSLHDYFTRTVRPNRKSATFWVSKGGRIEQYVPWHNEPWSQDAGNAQYNSAETEGYASEEFTLFQIAALAWLMRQGHHTFKWPYQSTNTPGHRGLIVHSAGGVEWGGHECPGHLRSAERPTIVRVAAGENCEPVGHALAQEVQHFKRHHGLPNTSVIGPRVRALLSL